jgi:hypothetical protein
LLIEYCTRPRFSVCSCPLGTACWKNSHNCPKREREYPLQLDEVDEEINLGGLAGRLLEGECWVLVLPVLVVAVCRKINVEAVWLRSANGVR